MNNYTIKNSKIEFSFAKSNIASVARFHLATLFTDQSQFNALRQPADNASCSVQNQRSPALSLITVWL